jgi:signal peptidase I
VRPALFDGGPSIVNVMDPQVHPDLPPPLPVAVAPEPPSAARSTLYWLRDLSMSVMIAVMVILFLYQPVKVEGTSMMP